MSKNTNTSRASGNNHGKVTSPVKWGILSTAKIARDKVIPAMMKSPNIEIVAIASRDLKKAQSIASELGIPRAYGSYDELLADPDIDAVYNPLPNDLHVPVSLQAAESGKHVLCEKPISMHAQEINQLIAARDSSGKLIAEAFMVRHHPQWIRARKEVKSGSIGELRAIQYVFSYFNDAASNIRNKPENGGGTLYDIGVYPIVTSRYIFEAEPRRVLGLMEIDPAFGTDRLVSAILDYEHGQASFLCSTQLVPYQRAQIFGTKKRIEIEIPFNAPNDRPTRLFMDDGTEPGDLSRTEISFDVTDQYLLQAEAFSQHIREDTMPEHPLEDSLSNMRVVDSLFTSAREGRWVYIDR
jgi:predicted dehydrogenase